MSPVKSCKAEAAHDVRASPAAHQQKQQQQQQQQHKQQQAEQPGDKWSIAAAYDAATAYRDVALLSPQ
jgi:hypothetical protein